MSMRITSVHMTKLPPYWNHFDRCLLHLLQSLHKAFPIMWFPEMETISHVNKNIVLKKSLWLPWSPNASLQSYSPDVSIFFNYLNKPAMPLCMWKHVHTWISVLASWLDVSLLVYIASSQSFSQKITFIRINYLSCTCPYIAVTNNQTARRTVEFVQGNVQMMLW